MVRSQPYPHLVLEDALPDELYEELAAAYPPMELFTKGSPYRSNRVMFYKAVDILGGKKVSELWREYTAYHTSVEFLADVLRVFGHHIRAMYPNVDWWTAKAGIRGVDSHDENDLLLDAQFGINTPVVGAPSSVRGMHIDNGDKLYNGLLYFRHPDDIAEGGDFLMHRQKNGHWIKAGRARYQANTLVFFINCAQAVHSVAERTASPYPRRYMSFAGEYSGTLFKATPIK